MEIVKTDKQILEAMKATLKRRNFHRLLMTDLLIFAKKNGFDPKQTCRVYHENEEELDTLYTLATFQHKTLLKVELHKLMQELIEYYKEEMHRFAGNIADYLLNSLTHSIENYHIFLTDYAIYHLENGTECVQNHIKGLVQAFIKHNFSLSIEQYMASQSVTN